MTQLTNCAPARAGGTDLLALTSGAFGRAVGDELVAHGWQAREARDAAATVVGSRAVVLAAWRDDPALMNAVEDACAERRVPWLSIVPEPPWIRVGPCVYVERTACERCFRARQRQHDRHPALSAALLEAYRRDPDVGVRGFLPHHVSIATGLALDAMDHLERQAEGHAQVLRYHTLRHEIAVDHVVGVHGCRCCDTDAPARNIERLRVGAKA